MSCNNGPFVIYTGDQKTMNLRAVSGSTGDPLDLTACTEIKVSLPNADGTFTHRLLSLAQVAITSPALLGKFSTIVTSAISAILNPGELQSFDVTFTISGAVFTVPYLQALSVFENN